MSTFVTVAKTKEYQDNIFDLVSRSIQERVKQARDEMKEPKT